MARHFPPGDVSIADIQDGFPVETLKAKTAQAYLSWHKLVDSGIKAELLRRVRDHLKFRKHGSLKEEYPPSSFSIPCNGAVCQGDVVMFKHYEDPIIAARVISVSQQCRNFTVEVLWSEGNAPREPFSTWKYLWRHVEELRLFRQPAENEQRRERDAILNHSRYLRLAEAREKDSNPTRTPRTAPRKNHDAAFPVPDANFPDVLSFRDGGRGPSSAIVPRPVGLLVERASSRDGDQGSGVQMYTGRVLDFGECEIAVQSPQGREKNHDRSEQHGNEDGDGIEMYTGRVLDFGGEEPIETQAEAGSGEAAASSDRKKRKRREDKDATEDAQARGKRERESKAGARPELRRKRRRERDVRETGDDAGEVLDVANSEPLVQHSEFTDQEAAYQDQDQDQVEMYAGRILDFGDSEPVVLDTEERRDQDETERGRVDKARHKGCKRKAETRIQTAESTPKKFQPHEVNRAPSSAARRTAGRAKPLGGPKSTKLYKKRPNWDRKWNPQCHVGCATEGCRNHAPRRCAGHFCVRCCSSSRCAVHKIFRSTG